MTAGFYEDPSALFSGWSENPVPFDSVFNHVAASWGLGSPDVVHIWGKSPHYTHQSYPAAMEDWSSNSDLAGLDTWVFDHMDYLLTGALCLRHRSATSAVVFISLQD